MKFLVTQAAFVGLCLSCFGGHSVLAQSERKSYFTEELTWEEVRDELSAGKSTLLVPVGGVEPNGPHVVTGKHNYIVRVKAEAVAIKLGNALIAPVVPFVPEGDIDPPTEHMKSPGTISISEELFEKLIVDICASYRTHGFRNIVLLGDGGESQVGLKRVASRLNSEWKNRSARVHFVPEFYQAQGLKEFLETRGIVEVDEGIHESFKVSAVLASIDPELIRWDRRTKAGKASINGVSLTPLEKTAQHGREIVQWYADRTVSAIKKSIEGSSER